MDPSCSQSEAFWVLVVDSTGSADQLVKTLISTVLFGVATSLAIASVYILLRTCKRSVAAMRLLCGTLILYISTAVFWGAAINRHFVYAREVSAIATSIQHCDVQTLYNPIHTAAVGDVLVCMQTATLTISVVIGDAIVWWRAYLLWTGRSRYVVLCLSTAFVLATFAISVVDTCGACNFALVHEQPGNGQLFSGSGIGAAASILSLASNVLATCLTAYKTWVHSRMLRRCFSHGSAITNVERILILLTESGIAYSIIWTLVTIYQIGVSKGSVYENNLASGSRDTFWAVMGYFVEGGLVPIIAIYPMVIIVLVALNKTQMENTFSTRSDRSSTGPVLSTHLATPISPTRPGGGHTFSLVMETDQRRASHVPIPIPMRLSSSFSSVAGREDGVHSCTEDADTLQGTKRSLEVV